MIKQLRRKDILKLALALDLPLINIQKLVAHRIIDLKGAVETLILHDWKQMKWDGRLSSKDIIHTICKEYDCSTSKVTAVVYAKISSNTTNCVKCGMEIKYSEFKKNGGLCAECSREP